jgi:hypothetical protein
MANEVYANGREISCKAATGKTVCAFPDVCFTPPQTPATPPGVPIPYPNSAMASDTSGGSKNVKISGKEVGLKNQSYFSKSMGDEAGCAPKKGIISSTNRGKVFFTCWSMDVKIESENAVRHLDLTTDNHASQAGNESVPWIYADKQTVPGTDKCAGEKEREKAACQNYKPNGDKDVCEEAGLMGGVVQSKADAKAAGFSSPSAWADSKAKKSAANDCARARRCQLVPYDAKKDGIGGCCPSQTADHLIPKASFYKNAVGGPKVAGWGDYNMNKAPCICAEGGSNTAGSHGLRHSHHKSNGPEKGSMQSFDSQADLAAEGATTVFKSSGCTKDCIKAQLENGHKDMGKGKIKHAPSGKKMTNEEITASAAKFAPETVAR